MRTLRSATFVLEPQVRQHAEEMFAVLSDPRIYAIEGEPPPSLGWLQMRFARLETRRSGDGREQWLNWVIRVRGNGLAGYVQATVHADGQATIAYVLGSEHWGRGLATAAVQAMMAELAERYGVVRFAAVLKRSNGRSARLLERLGFTAPSEEQLANAALDPDEMLRVRAAQAGDRGS